MTQDVQQWLTEIQSLQQRLSEVSQERATAYDQLARWQRAYQTEAQQRRKDLRRLQTVIYRLDQENKRLKQQLSLPPDARSPFFMSNEPHLVSGEPILETAADFSSSSELNQPSKDEEISSSSSSTIAAPAPVSKGHTTQLQEKLKETLAECDRLAKALSQEQLDHEQTRQTLMTALGDTVEQLERERQRHAQFQSQQEQSGANLPTLAPQQPDNLPLPEQQQPQLAPAPPSVSDPPG